MKLCEPVIFILCELITIIHSLYVLDSKSCYLPSSVKREILSHQPLVNRIIDEVINGSYSGKYYDHLTEFVDEFMSRMTGTKNLENAINYVSNLAESRGFIVKTEQVAVPYWRRGEEQAELLSPKKKKLAVIGLGYSGSGEVTGEVLVIKDFIQLKVMEKKVKGRIVLFNPEFTDYASAVEYRVRGPSEASKLGATAVLVRSVTPFSIYSPHTGMTSFEKNEYRIPAAAITLEDADLIARYYNAEKVVKIHVRLLSTLEYSKMSHNLIIDLPGKDQTNDFVVVSGHIDSWDVGLGALDDGVGAFLALHTLFLLQFMNLPRPKKTIRVILWTGEEMGLLGANSYLVKHLGELERWSAAMEADGGSYYPLGLNIKGSEDAKCVLELVTSLFNNLNATRVVPTSSAGSDITVFGPFDVPLIEPSYDKNNYFWFHHTEGDSMRTLDSHIMDRNLALFAGTAYVLANITANLPRTQISEHKSSIW